MAVFARREALTQTDRFLEHWAEADAALAPGSLKLLGPFARGDLLVQRNNLEALGSAVIAKTNALQTAAGDRELKRRALGPRFDQFRSAVLAYLPATAYPAALPPKPRLFAGSGAWAQATDAVAALWARIDANDPPAPGFTPPLLLAGGYALAGWTADAAAERAASAAWRKARQEARLAVRDRDAQLLAVARRLVQYRQAVRGRFAAGSAVEAALPRLTPVRDRRKRTGQAD